MKDRFGQRLMNWRIAAVLPHLRGRVLDIGCGTNDLLRRYRSLHPGTEAAESIGVDVFDWPGADLLVENSAELPYEGESFDTVSIVAALNHIPNRQDVLGECHRLIRPGGRLVLTMIPPALSWCWHQLRRPWDADQIERGMQPGEVYGLSRRRIEAMLQRAEFAPTSQHRFMLGLNLLAVAEPVAEAAAQPGAEPATLEAVVHHAAVHHAVARRRSADPAADAIEAAAKLGDELPRPVTPRVPAVAAER